MLVIVNGRLFETFSYLDSIKHTQEVCLEEKVSAAMISNPMTKWVPKLKCSIPFKS